MKPVVLVPPAAILIAGTAWLASQTASISRLERGNSILATRIADHANRPESAAPDAETSGRGTTAGKSGNTTDWKTLAGQILQMQGSSGIPDIRLAMRVQQLLSPMSGAELANGLDEIAKLDLPESSRLQIVDMLRVKLVEKDFDLALQRFSAGIDEYESDTGWTLASGARSWAQQDPEKAAAWLDQQIASGVFDSKSLDGRNQMRLFFEGALVSTLLAADPEQASSRLSGIPPELRAETLRGPFSEPGNEETQLAFARLVREQLKPEEQTDALMAPAGTIVASGGFPAVSAYLDRIGATPPERASAVEKIVSSKLSGDAYQRKLSSTDIDEARAWAATQVPGQVDQATGKLLGNLPVYGGTSAADTVALAIHYHEISGNDEMLAAYLEGVVARSNRALVLPLVEKISDPERRERIRESLNPR